MPTNVEIKARLNNPEKIKTILKSRNALFKGIDYQIDTYFKISSGRLKLRKGNIENNLIYYSRPNQAGPKKSEIILVNVTDPNLNKILTKVLELLAVVDKKREIYFVDNIKFHIDEVKGLGSFVEIEVIDETGKISVEKLTKDCEKYMKLFDISKEDLISESYSDMILQLS